MWPGSPTLELSTNVFKILGDLIHERTGLHYDFGKRELLAEKLSPLAVERGFGSFLDFYYLLKYGPEADHEWPRVIDALSVQETYFWREMGQIHALVDELLPRYVSQYPGRPVRIWCAACATGEEPLTIAMSLAEAGWFARADIQIHASDVSPAAIAKARQGVYRERSFRALPEPLRAKYFTAFANGWRINSDVFARVTWSQANLVQADEIAELVGVPFIFCRNVFIYFAEETIARTIRLIAQGMVRPGYLFVGAAESLLKLTDDFELVEAGDAFAYALK
jgi:chemotaxis protein methyltransferase CheR